MFHFVHFEDKIDFWHILVKFIVYRVFILSSRSDKKQLQLVDLTRSYIGYIQAFRLADLPKNP